MPNNEPFFYQDLSDVYGVGITLLVLALGVAVWYLTTEKKRLQSELEKWQDDYKKESDGRLADAKSMTVIAERVISVISNVADSVPRKTAEEIRPDLKEVQGKLDDLRRVTERGNP